MSEYKTESRDDKDGNATYAVAFCTMSLSTLGGEKRATLMFRATLDARETWINGIYQNSRYAQFSVGRDGRVNVFSWGGKRHFAPWRSFKAKSVAHATERLVKWFEASMKIGTEG